MGAPLRKNDKTIVFGRGDNPVNFVSAEESPRWSTVPSSTESRCAIDLAGAGLRNRFVGRSR